MVRAIRGDKVSTYLILRGTRALFSGLGCRVSSAPIHRRRCTCALGASSVLASHVPRARSLNGGRTGAAGGAPASLDDETSWTLHEDLPRSLQEAHLVQARERARHKLCCHFRRRAQKATICARTPAHCLFLAASAKMRAFQPVAATWWPRLRQNCHLCASGSAPRRPISSSRSPCSRTGVWPCLQQIWTLCPLRRGCGEPPAQDNRSNRGTADHTPPAAPRDSSSSRLRRRHETTRRQHPKSAAR